VSEVRNQRLALRIPSPLPRQIRRWTRAEEKLLGTDRDTVIAKKLRRSEDAVADRRRKLKIPKSGNQRPRYTPEQDRLLGTISDEELAHRLGRTPRAIQFRRTFLGIPKFNPLRRNWTAEEKLLLGKMPDDEVARQLRRTLSSIIQKRFRLDIADFAPQPRMKRRPQNLNSRLRAKPEPAPSCNCRPWTPAEKALLGKLPDKIIAERLGRTRGAIRGRRSLYGLHDPSTRPFWSKDHDKLLGTATDKEIARQTGFCSETVAKQRRALGIPAFGESLIGLSQTPKAC
jgi:hypothetical protein